MTTNSSAKSTSRFSFKLQTLTVLCAVALAVALPQVFHSAGAALGLGNSLGETFLPMHLPVLAAGFIAGPFAGAVAGLLSPVVSFALSGMPGILMLPIISAELCAYGIISGLLMKKDIPVFPKLIITQLGGRAVRAITVLIAVYVFGSEISISTIWMSVVTGISGILLQWAVIPATVNSIEKIKKK